MSFTLFFYEPIVPDAIPIEHLSQDRILNYFEQIAWNDYLQQSYDAKLDDIYYSPCFEIKKEQDKTGLVIAAVGAPNHFMFNITYQPPAKVRSFWGFMNLDKEHELRKLEKQTQDEATACLNAFLNDDFAYLKSKLG